MKKLKKKLKKSKKKIQALKMQIKSYGNIQEALNKAVNSLATL